MRGVGDRHAGQRRHLGLELEQGLQRALGDLRLVGRVAGQELRPLDDVVDAGRHMVAIGPGAAEERPGRPPAGCCAARRASARSTSSSPWCGGRSTGPASRAAAGTSTNRASMRRRADRRPASRRGRCRSGADSAWSTKLRPFPSRGGAGVGVCRRPCGRRESPARPLRGHPSLREGAACGPAHSVSRNGS